MIRASKQTVALALTLALARPAAAAPATPPSAFFRFGLESAANADGPGSLLFNPAAGVRYHHELSLTLIDLPHDKDWGRVALTTGPMTISASGERGGAITPSLGAATGPDRFRLGTVTTWWPIAGGDRARDYRIGALSRPVPWLSLGGVADHLGRPRLETGRLDREYTVGVGVRPFAMSRGKASSWGTRVTLTADARFESGSDREWRYGGEVEVVSGLIVRGIWFKRERGFQLGVSLLGITSGYHAQSLHRSDGRAIRATHTLSIHKEEDRTILVPPNQKRVAVVSVGGDLADESMAGFSISGGVSTTAVGPIHRQLQRALEDPLTRGVLLDLRGCGGSAQIEELRPRIERLRSAGKPVVAFIEYGSRRGDLFLASACDRVVTTPDAIYPGLGLRFEERYYRKFLDDHGVRIDRTSYGKYKSAYRNYSVDRMPAPDREVIDHTLDVVQELFVSSVARDRGVERERLTRVLDGRLWPPRDLQSAGLIDSIGFREDARRIVGRLAGLGSRPRVVRLASRPSVRREWTVPTRIAVVYASGGIERGRSGNDLLLGPTLGSETLSGQIERAFKRADVEAVVLRVESPGGETVASGLIQHTLLRMKRETGKPLVVSMGRSAASGGYQISVDADRIFADRFTATGSIGVLLVKPSIEGWYAKHDVRQEDLERGRYMRGWSQNRDWDAEIQATADSATQREYRDFVTLVAAGRRMTWDQVDAVAQGRVWLGDDALRHGLVDEIGGLEQAIAEARRRAGIPAAEKIEIAEYRRPAPGLVQRVVGGAVVSAMREYASLPEPGQTLHWMDDLLPIP